MLKLPGRVVTMLCIIAGIGLAVFVMVLLFARDMSEDKDAIKGKDTIKEESAIDSLYIKFEGYVRESDFASAYELMSPSYKARKRPKDFIARFDFLQKKEEYRLHPQRLLKIEGNTALLFPHDTSSSAWWLGIGFEFQKIEGKWYLTGKMVTYQD